MNIDIRTLAFVLSISSIIQAIAIFVQFRVNSTYRGIGWWLSGTVSMAFGYSLLLSGGYRALELLSWLANPLLVLGHIFVYIGIIEFLGNREKKNILIGIYLLFCLGYFYFVLIDYRISGRTLVVSLSIAAIALMSAYKLFFKRDKLISASANFTALIFFFHGCFLLTLAFLSMILPPTNTYSEVFKSPIYIITYIVPIVTSTLSTFGFIIMVNQRLNAENREEREKMERIFNTSPDAALITRLIDGLLVEVNEGFLNSFGYNRDELYGVSSISLNIWVDINDRKIFLKELKEKGYCANKEFIFAVKMEVSFGGLFRLELLQ